MYGQWSDDGEAIFATRSRTSPILYDVCFIKISLFAVKIFVSIWIVDWSPVFSINRLI